MNHYGRLAMAHWQQHRPMAMATIEDPTEFFTDLGDQVQGAITSLRDALLAQRPAMTDQVGVQHRGSEALTTAEEVVLADLVLLPAEPEAMDPDPALDAYYARLATANRALDDPT